MKQGLPSVLFLVMLSGSACHSASSQVKAGAAATPAPVEQVVRVVPFESIRYVMVRGPQQPTINPHYNLNAAYYLCGKCNPGTDASPGKIGLSTGAVVQTARFGKVGTNWVEFPFEADGAYIETAYSSTIDKSKAGPVTSYYRLVFDDDTHARVLSSSYDASGNAKLYDYGYRMTWDDGLGMWHRFSDKTRDPTDGTPNYQYTDQAPQQYRLFEIYTGDNNETKFTQQFIDDQAISRVTKFAVKVAATDPLADGDLPTGPFRDADRDAAKGDSPDASDHDGSSDVDAKANGSGDSKDAKSAAKAGAR